MIEIQERQQQLTTMYLPGHPLAPYDLLVSYEVLAWSVNAWTAGTLEDRFAVKNRTLFDWEAAEREADYEIRHGRYADFESVDGLLDDLRNVG